MILKKHVIILNNIIKGSTFSNYLNTTLLKSSADNVSLYFSNIEKNLSRNFNSNSGLN